MSVCAAAKVPFSDLCQLCEKISNKDSKEKRQALKSFVEEWRKFHNNLHKDDPTTEDSFHPALRLLLPQFDKDRGAYGIKENTLAKLYIQILCLNKDGADAQRLLNYRTPQGGQVSGDFATVAYFVLKDRCPKNGKLTISDINTNLDAIAVNNAAKNKELVRKHLLHLLRNTSALEQKWLIRMIMKEMKMGISEKTIFSVYHPDAKDLYDVSNNLVKVCVSLRNPEIRLHEIEISLFSPFRPMLADRQQIEKVEKLMDNKPFYVETKYDGERLQLHKKGNDFKYFSRNGYDYTEIFGSNVEKGTITPYIARAIHTSVENCILDGEVVGYNVKNKCIDSKGENFDVKALRDGDSRQPCVIVFDVLLLNGKVLSNVPLKQRLQQLQDMFDEVEGRIQFASRKEAKNRQEVVEALNLAIDNREEGIVVKSPDSVYRPNTRKGGWLKIKPEYVDGLMDQLDLIIIGGYFGEGRRAGVISHFMLGVAVTDPSTKDSKPTLFHSFARVGSGYTLQQLYELCQKLNDHWRPYDRRKPPKNIILAPGHKERPDLWVEPSKSFIVQVKAAEIVSSDKFKSGCTLRFPRVEKVRYDKSWHECLTTAELEEIRKQADGKLASRHMDDHEESPRKRQAIAVKPEKAVTLAPHLRSINPNTIAKISSCFQGKEICVLNAPPGYTRIDLEKLIIEHGGKVVKNPCSSTSFVVATHKTVHTTNIVKSKRYDVLQAEWLLHCVDEKKFINWCPADFMYITDVTAAKLSEDFDRFGDSFVNDIDSHSLQRIFERINYNEIEESLKNEAIAEMECELFSHTPKFGLFRLCRVYIDKYAVIEESETMFQNYHLDLAEVDLHFYGASFTLTLEDASHVVIHSSHKERAPEFISRNQERKVKFHIVTEAWVYGCVQEERLIPEREYYPKLM